MVAASWSTGQTWSSPTSPAQPLALPTGLQVPPWAPFTATPFQRWAGVQPQVENSPTVAAEPGENLPSQNRPRKDVFPTEELPTNTILKSRSGVDGKPSSCGRQIVGSITGRVTSPHACHPQPSPIPAASRDSSNQQGRLLGLGCRKLGVQGTGAPSSTRCGKRDMPSSTTDAHVLGCRPCAGLGLRRREGGRVYRITA